MNSVILSNNQFDPEGHWSKPIAKLLYEPTYEDIALFDQNGYDLTVIEQHFAYGNFKKTKKHREHQHQTLKQEWFTQFVKIEGSVLNHSVLFERKGYSGEALEQLTHWADKLPLIHKIIAIRPKWGLDFSMDYVDRQGNSFEVIHWEYDGFNFDEIQSVKQHIEVKLANIDWDHAGEQMLLHKDKWHHLGFFEQSDWKCNFFGIPKERFKMVIWS